jgi:hypothetical protein
MQPSEHAKGGTRQVVLHERAANAVAGVAVRLERLDEEATLIAQHFRLDDHHVGDRGRNDVHAKPARSQH